MKRRQHHYTTEKAKLLKALARTNGWTTLSFGVIRRCHGKMGIQCPLTAVAGISGIDFRKAAKKLGIIVSLASDIADAADGAPTILREELIKACRL